MLAHAKSLETLGSDRSLPEHFEETRPVERMALVPHSLHLQATAVPPPQLHCMLPAKEPKSAHLHRKAGVALAGQAAKDSPGCMGNECWQQLRKNALNRSNTPGQVLLRIGQEVHLNDVPSQHPPVLLQPIVGVAAPSARGKGP